MKQICILDCEIGRSYIISKINLDVNIKMQLKNFVIDIGGKITILHKSFGGDSLMIKVLGINYVLDKNVCAGIEVYDA